MSETPLPWDLDGVYDPTDATVTVRLTVEFIEDAARGVLGPEAKMLAEKLMHLIPEVE